MINGGIFCEFPLPLELVVPLTSWLWLAEFVPLVNSALFAVLPEAPPVFVLVRVIPWVCPPPVPTEPVLIEDASYILEFDAKVSAYPVAVPLDFPNDIVEALFQSKPEWLWDGISAVVKVWLPVAAADLL